MRSHGSRRSFSQYGPPALSRDDFRIVLVAGCGIVISVLLAALVGAFVRARLQTLRLAAELAARRQAEQELREKISAAAPPNLYAYQGRGEYTESYLDTARRQRN